MNEGPGMSDGPGVGDGPDLTGASGIGVERPILVVGLGSIDRGDDAVGPVVARAIAALDLPGVEVVEHEDPTDLLELWSGRHTVVVVDAVRSGAEPGTLHILKTGPNGARLVPSAAWAGKGGTHAFGLPAAVDLARALGRLPREVFVVGVEAGRFGHGSPLSPPVASAVASAVDTVTELTGRPMAGTVRERGTGDVPR
jgi:hydrogenase maturation protease